MCAEAGGEEARERKGDGGGGGGGGGGGESGSESGGGGGGDGDKEDDEAWKGDPDGRWPGRGGSGDEDGGDQDGGGEGGGVEGADGAATQEGAASEEEAALKIQGAARGREARRRVAALRCAQEEGPAQGEVLDNLERMGAEGEASAGGLSAQDAEPTPEPTAEEAGKAAAKAEGALALERALALLKRLEELDGRKGHASDLREGAAKGERQARELLGQAAAQLQEAAEDATDREARGTLAEAAQDLVKEALLMDASARAQREQADAYDKGFNREVVVLRSDCIRHQASLDRALGDQDAALAVSKQRHRRLRRRAREVESLKELKRITEASAAAIKAAASPGKLKKVGELGRGDGGSEDEAYGDDASDAENGEAELTPELDDEEEVGGFVERLESNRRETERIQVGRVQPTGNRAHPGGASSTDGKPSASRWGESNRRETERIQVGRVQPTGNRAHPGGASPTDGKPSSSSWDDALAKHNLDANANMPCF